jgi:hypothetical protein
MDYELITSELWMDYEIMNGNPCEWIPIIMWSCLMLAFVTLTMIASTYVNNPSQILLVHLFNLLTLSKNTCVYLCASGFCFWHN